MMGVTALWTAVHYRIPLSLVVAHNRSFFNDELHQEQVARMRSRPVENKWIGQRIDDPAIDMAKLAEGQDAVGSRMLHRWSKYSNAPLPWSNKGVSRWSMCV